MLKKYMGKIVYYIVTLAIAAVFVAPLWMVLVNSFKEKKEAAHFAVAFPKEWLISNYAEVFENASVLKAFFNSMVLSVGTVLIVLAVSLMAAFAIARSSSRLATVCYYIFLCGLIIPLAFIPTYLVLDTLNLLDTYLGLILVSAAYGFPMAIFLYTGFMKTIPRELDEAAALDGCPPFRLIFQIIVPLLKPVTMTVLILNFVGTWNGVQIPLYFATSDKWGLPLTVYNFYGAHASSWNLVFADIIITVLPLLVLYLFGQKYIISGMTAGAVKS